MKYIYSSRRLVIIYKIESIRDRNEIEIKYNSLSNSDLIYCIKKIRYLYYLALISRFVG